MQRDELIKALRYAQRLRERPAQGANVEFVAVPVDVARRAADEIERLSAAVPAGWKLVPAEPTWDMVSRAGGNIWDTATEAHHWLAANAVRAAIAASPSPPEMREEGA